MQTEPDLSQNGYGYIADFLSPSLSFYLYTCVYIYMYAHVPGWVGRFGGGNGGWEEERMIWDAGCSLRACRFGTHS